MTGLDDLLATWRARTSIRAFRPEPLDRDVLEQIFGAAQAAPSWCNVQPWRAVVTSPPRTAPLGAALVRAASGQGFLAPEVPFPKEYPSPHREHRASCGKALYRAMDIARDDQAARHDAWLRNFVFFDAPHVAIVSYDARLGPYGALDVGIWLGYLLTAATTLGVATCPMASLAGYPKALRAELALPETDTILFGLALGHALDGAPANGFRTSREPVAANVTFV